jgi:hypothetical protein
MWHSKVNCLPCAGQISIAACLKQPLGFEPVDQKTGTAKTNAWGKTGLWVGLLPVLDRAAEWAAKNMSKLEGKLMMNTPATSIAPHVP